MPESVTLRDDGVASDAALIAGVRSGDQAAAAELYQRHAGAAWVVARQYSDGPADADDVVADSFTAVLGALGRGHGPEAAFRAYLFTVVRRVAAARRDAGRRVRPTDDLATLEAGTALAGTAEEPALAGFERGVVARAFHSLPERWQAVLWHTEVEGLPPADVAPLLGLTANGVAALAYRAREGLRQAYLQQHLADPGPDGCRAVAGKLGGYVRGGLSARDARKVEEHLEGCGDCRALVLELQDVNHGMRAVIAPLVLGLVGLGALAHTLPVGGGIAAGLAALRGGAAGGSAAGGGAAGGGAAAGAGAGAAEAGGAGAGGAGAGAGATGAGAAGAGATGTVAAGAASAGAAGAGVAGAAGGAAAAGGVAAGVAGGAAGAAGLLASVPLGVVALTVGGLVIAGAAVVGAVNLLGDSSSPDAAAASPSSSVSAPSESQGSTADVDPTGGATASTGVPSPTDLPSSGSSLVAVPVGGQVVTGQALPQPTAEPTTQPTSEPQSPPAGPAQPSSSAEPTTPVNPPPPPAPASVTVQLPVGGLQLDAGAGDQSLTIGIANSGDLAAQNLVADVTLPPGFAVAGLSVAPQATTVTGRFAAAGAEGWVCTTGDTGSSARCDLAVLPGRTSQLLTLSVTVDESFEASDGEVGLHVVGTDLDFRSTPIPVTVRPAPARLALLTQPVSPAFVTDVPTALHLDLANVGGTAGTVGVHVTLPTGLRWTSAATSVSWQCSTATGGVDCARSGVGARTPVPLDLGLVAGAPADVAGRSLDVSVAPAGRAVADTVVPFTVSRPVLSVANVTAQVGTTTGTVSFQVSNGAGPEAATATGVQATVRLPASLEADPNGIDNNAPAAGESRAWCEVVAASTLSCHLPDLAPGTSVQALADVRVRGAAVGVVQVEATAVGSPPASATGVVRTASGDLEPRVQLAGGWAVTEVGAPLLSCGNSSESRCRGALDKGDADNNALTMAPLDEAGGPPGARSSVPVSSSTRLTVPAHRQVAFAGLYWSANRGPKDAFSGPVGSALLRGPSGAWTPVAIASAGDLTTVTDNRDRTYYQSFVDVTSMVAAQVAQSDAATTTWSLADAAVSRTRTDGDPTYYAGWALVVVYADPDTSSAVTVYDGGAWIGTSTQPPVFSFVGQAGAQVRVGVVAWEGDRGSTGDRLTLGDASGKQTALTPVRSNGSPGQSSNAFDSTATGWSHGNSLGVDAKGFLPVTLDSDIGSLTATTTGDQYLIGAVTIRTTTGQQPS